jgi:hydroxymethylpyrimidine/phosphomethylpyrimidine kinase
VSDVETPAKIGRVLAIAGSDSGGGAGIQADLKTVTAHGGFAASALTAVTVQNTMGVEDVHMLPTDLVVAQVRSVLDDIGADVIKTGMLGTKETVSAVSELLAEVSEDIPIVCDPVVAAKGGERLMSDEVIEEMKRRLLLHVRVITPNIMEAEILTRLSIENVDDMKRAGERMLSFGCEATVIKGGHLKGDMVRDVLVSFDGDAIFESPRLQSRNTHGTGCVLAAAIAANMASGQEVEEAIRNARTYVRKAIELAPGFGQGHGPMHLGWTATPPRGEGE